MSTVSIEKLNSKNKVLIDQIANWYLKEWNIPKERSISRLTNHPNEDVLFQVVLKIDDIPVATGGLYNNVSLFNQYPEFRKLKPWVALLYTEKEHRNKGLGAKLLYEIEMISKELKYKKIYLYTFTAEALYKRNGWLPIERVDYHGHDSVIMEKILFYI